MPQAAQELVHHQQGTGPAVLLIHGSAADNTTWTVQMASLRRELRMLAYDRVGIGDNPMPAARAAAKPYTIEDHADDAFELLAAEVQGPCVVAGSSFGAIVALDVARRYPKVVSHLVMCEPPLAPSDYLTPVPDGFACRFDALLAEAGGEAASEFFLRCVLGEVAFERMPKAYRHRSMAAWQQIRWDMSALARYRVRYSQLAEQVRCPVSLLGGENSSSFYRDTLEALHSALPSSQLQVMRGAGHMMHVEAHRQFAAVLRAATHPG